MSEDVHPHAQRIRVLGRSIVSHFQQLFRNAELFEPNNVIFARLSQTLSNYIAESYRFLGGCTLRLSSYQVFLEDSRVFIDSGMVEAVNFLSTFFGAAEIGGVFFHEECQDPKILLKALFAFRETVLDDKARGDEAIKKGLIRRHTPYILPLPLSRAEATMTGIRDLNNAKKFALRNAAKFIMFLEDMEPSLEKKEAFRINIAHRVILNLIRVNEVYPHLIISLTQIQIADQLLSQLFHGVLLLLAVGKRLGLSRQTQIDLAVAAVFQNLGYQTIPPPIRESDRMQDYLPSVPDRAARKLMETRFFNRALFFRIVLAYQCPIVPNPVVQPRQALPVTRLLRTINHFVAAWKHGRDKAMLPLTCVKYLLSSKVSTVDRSFLLLVGDTLGLLQPGSVMVLDQKIPVSIVGILDGDVGKMELVSIAKDPREGIQRFRWDLPGGDESEALIQRLSYIEPDVAQPNALRAAFRTSDR